MAIGKNCQVFSDVYDVYFVVFVQGVPEKNTLIPPSIVDLYETLMQIV